MFEWLLDPSAWMALATLTLLEIVLGIDNIIFISILVGKLPPQQRQRARVLGLAGAMITRVLLLLSLAWVMRLTHPLFSILNEAISGRDIILIVGGLFLLAKSTHEIHGSLEGSDNSEEGSTGKVVHHGFAEHEACHFRIRLVVQDPPQRMVEILLLAAVLAVFVQKQR